MSATTITASPGLRSLLRVPGVAWLLGAALVGRLPTATLSLLYVLRTRELTGSLGLAGAVAGINAVAMGVTMPLLGRVVDRRGQRPVLAVCTVIAGSGMLALALLPHGVGAAPLVACALVTGAGLPPVGSCVRALLPVLLDDPDRRHAAFSLDSALVEVGYVAGPALIAGALGAWGTSAACAACALLLVTGVGAFAAHPAAGRPISAERPESRGLGALRTPSVRVLIVVLALVGLAFGAIEVGVPAVAVRAGVPHAAGLLVGVWGLGSMIGGLAGAHVRAPADPARRARWLLAVLAVAELPLALGAHPSLLAVLLVVAGVAIAPTFACIFGMLDGIVPAGTVTESYGWLTTGITAGAACGAALGGQLAERVSPSAALSVAGVATGLGAVVAWAGRGALSA